MKKLFVSLLVLLMILTIGAEVKAQEAKSGGRGPDLMALFRPPNDKELDTITQQLQLTEEQHSKMQSINTRYKSEIQALMDKYQNARQDLLHAFQGTPNPDRVENDMKNLNQIHTSIVSKETELWTAISDTLSEEQAIEFWRLFGKSRLRIQGAGGAGAGARQVPQAQ
jgi:Spy/CpxP family protein refolding chaperone